MVGQSKLINIIKSYTVKNFPHTVLLIGEEGCGKHTVVSEIIAPHLGLPVIDMTEYISFDYILNIRLKALPVIYLINLSVITEKQQNILLKFIEEPVVNSYIILISESDANILETIKNRCVTYRFEKYSTEELSPFIKEIKEEHKNLVLKVCTTPGQVLSAARTNLDEIYALCQKMSLKLSEANFPNTLTIAKKINYKDNYDKFDINIFLNVLSLILFNDYIEKNNLISFKLYNKVSEYKNMLYDLRLNRELLMENMLTSLWKLARE